MSLRTILLSILAMTAGAGCAENAAPAPPAESAPCERPPSAREPLWKRVGAVTRDLQRALALGEDEVCNELGSRRCAEVYKIPLGGSDAANQGINRPPSEPLLTTTLALERTVLSACIHRVDADKAGSPVVFGQIDLERPDLPLSDANIDAAVSAQIVALYRRLLSRDPTTDEIARLKALVVDADGQPISARDFAVLSCFAVGTSTDFLFL